MGRAKRQPGADGAKWVIEPIGSLLNSLSNWHFSGLETWNHGKGWSAPGLVGSVAFEAKGEVPQLKEAAQIQLWQRNWWQTITYIISQKTMPFQEPLDSQSALQLAKHVARLLFFVGSFGFTGWCWFLNQGRNLLYRCWSGVLGGGWLLKGLVWYFFLNTVFQSLVLKWMFCIRSRSAHFMIKMLFLSKTEVFILDWHRMIGFLVCFFSSSSCILGITRVNILGQASLLLGAAFFITSDPPSLPPDDSGAACEPRASICWCKSCQHSNGSVKTLDTVGKRVGGRGRHQFASI